MLIAKGSYDENEPGIQKYVMDNYFKRSIENSTIPFVSLCKVSSNNLSKISRKKTRFNVASK